MIEMKTGTRLRYHQPGDRIRIADSAGSPHVICRVEEDRFSLYYWLRVAFFVGLEILFFAAGLMAGLWWWI